jgi:signal transduction histidine kinase
MARRRLARDIHDGAQQQFLAAVINAQRAEQKWSSDPATAKQLLDTSTELAQAGLQTLRDLVGGSHPSILTQLGLRSAVEVLAEPLPLPVRVDVSIDRLPAALEVSVYFFVSEALTNVLKHARASAAAVRIAAADDELNAEVCDDGVGGANLSSTGTGLTGLTDRVAALHGQLLIRSAAGLGTTLRVTIPMPPRASG